MDTEKSYSTIYIDLGSSTAKVYGSQSHHPELIATQSIPLKKDFDPASGISQENKKELFTFIQQVTDKNPKATIKIIATALFRKLSKEAQVSLKDEFFQETGLYLNIISQDLENYYLETALVDKCTLNEPLLLINIGGGSTELVVMYGKQAIERHNIDLGVGTLLGEFQSINDSLSGTPIEDVIHFIDKRLPDLQNHVTHAFYNGGELTYMQLAEYPLKKNTLFSDEEHPSIIDFTAFSKKNKDIFGVIPIQTLESLMPNDPKWMHGARSCSAIAQAICSRYQIKTIIPSNSNTIDGLYRNEYRYITISGSFRKHLDQIISIKERFESQGTYVLSPRFLEPKNPGDEFVIFTGEEGKSPLELERHHLESIEKSDALIICNPDGYVGASALIEIGYAQALGKKIVFVEKPEEFLLNILPAEIGL